MNLRTKKLLGASCILLAVVVVLGTALLLRANIAGPANTNANAQQSIALTHYQGQVRNFTLYVRDTEITTPDGKKFWAFGYTDDPKGPAKIPGPTLVVDEGDTVNVTLNNDKDPTKTTGNPDGDGHTIHFHGLDLPSAMDGDPMTSPTGKSVQQGTQFVYHFVAKHPGTYYYHCHEGAAEHIQMGMYGAFIVRPHGEPNRAYNDTPKFDKEYTLMMSEMDSTLHQADYNALYKGGDDPNWTLYRPDYFFFNGKSWPDTMKDPNTFMVGTVGQTFLIRLINSGYVVHAIHSHGFHFQVIGTDGRKLAQPYEKDTLLVGPSERYDIIVKLDQAGRYMFHDHIEQQNTNNGVYPGGMMTFINVNNKDGSNPVPLSRLSEGM